MGRAIVETMQQRGHRVVTVGRQRGDVRCDISDETQLPRLWQQVGTVDAVVCAAGDVRFAPLRALSSQDFMAAWQQKALAQINLVRTGVEHVAESGSFTLVSGILSRDPVQDGVAAATVNGAVEAFVRAAAIEIAPRRINVVSPSVLTESVPAFDAVFSGFPPIDAADVARQFVKCVEGKATGQVVC